MLAEFIFSIRLFRRELAAPAVVYSFSFFICTIPAAIFSQRWELGLHLNTFLVITVGGLIFISVCHIVEKVMAKMVLNPNKIHKHSWITIKSENIRDWKLYILLLIGVTTIVFTLYEEISLTGQENIVSAMLVYDQVSKFSDSENFVFSKPIWILRGFIDALGYWCIFVIVRNLSEKKKVSMLMYALLILALINIGDTGNRGGLVNYFVSLICVWLIFHKTTYREYITKKNIVMAIIIIGALLVAFRFSASLLGRETSGNIFEYLATYIGAQIKNLDIYLQTGTMNHGLGSSQTFINIITWLGPKTGLFPTTYKLDLPFQSINGFNLGNVYTTYYAFLYDFGYVGAVLLTALMAAISQIIYCSVLRNTAQKPVPLTSLIYIYIYSFLLFSFFSDKFYENVFVSYILYLIVYWIIIKLYMSDWKDRRRTIHIHLDN